MCELPEVFGPEIIVCFIQDSVFTILSTSLTWCQNGTSYSWHGQGEICSTTVIQMSLATSPWKSFRMLVLGLVARSTDWWIGESSQSWLRPGCRMSYCETFMGNRCNSSCFWSFSGFWSRHLCWLERGEVVSVQSVNRAVCRKDAWHHLCHLPPDIFGTEDGAVSGEHGIDHTQLLKRSQWQLSKVGEKLDVSENGVYTPVAIVMGKRMINQRIWVDFFRQTQFTLPANMWWLGQYMDFSGHSFVFGNDQRDADWKVKLFKVNCQTERQ